MNDLKIGDRVRVISESKLFKTNKNKIINGMIGTIKDQRDKRSGVEFDDYVGGHDGLWNGKDGHCWYVDNEYLEKIEETKADTKAEKMEQKILVALREGIGVFIGDEFEVYENGEKKWICRFEVRGFSHLINGEFYKSGIWKDIVYNLCRYTFKKKPFVPQNGEKYWHFGIRDSLKGNQSLDVLEKVWDSLLFDYGMLALGNVFRTKEEAFENKDKLLERLNELPKEE